MTSVDTDINQSEFIFSKFEGRYLQSMNILDPVNMPMNCEEFMPFYMVSLIDPR
jgi:hypothetical protein